MLLCENKTTNGATDEMVIAGGIVQFQISGTFDGATATPQVDQDGLGFADLVGLGQTVPDTNRIFLKSGCNFRFNITGAAGSTDLTISVI